MAMRREMSHKSGNLKPSGNAWAWNGSRSSILQSIFTTMTRGLFIRRNAKAATKTKISIHEPARISLSVQFERAAQVVEDAISQSEAIQALHRETSQQLDATEYALHRLFDEIHSVMPGINKPVYGDAIVRTGDADSFRPAALAA